MTSYCAYARTIQDERDVDRVFHDTRHGRRVEDDDELFGRLILEINQAGLSWRTILLKEEGLRRAYHNFSIHKIAQYDDRDIERLLADSAIIRNQRKIEAIIHNARVLEKMQKEHGSFRAWLDAQKNVHSDDQSAWIALFKQHFVFVGGDIVGEFLMGINLISGAHDADCPCYKEM